MLIVLFWMVCTLHVVGSTMMYVHAHAKPTAVNIALRAGQRKDDLLGIAVMAVALLVYPGGMTAPVYIGGTFIMVWLSRRSRARLDQMVRARQRD